MMGAAVVGGAMFLGGNNARAEIDYEGIKYLGGAEKVDILLRLSLMSSSEWIINSINVNCRPKFYIFPHKQIDLNNANIRAYLKVPGAYPGLASKIVAYGPFKSVGDVYSIPGLSGAEKVFAVLNFIAFSLCNHMYCTHHNQPILLYKGYS